MSPKKVCCPNKQPFKSYGSAFCIWMWHTKVLGHTKFQVIFAPKQLQKCKMLKQSWLPRETRKTVSWDPVRCCSSASTEASLHTSSCWHNMFWKILRTEVWELETIYQGVLKHVSDLVFNLFILCDKSMRKVTVTFLSQSSGSCRLSSLFKFTVVTDKNLIQEPHPCLILESTSLTIMANLAAYGFLLSWKRVMTASNTSSITSWLSSSVWKSQLARLLIPETR